MTATTNEPATKLLPLSSPGKAFGSQCAVYADINPVAADEIAGWWSTIEASWSRFIPSSDLCSVNENAGSWVEVPPHLAAAVRHALQLRELTDGIFDLTTRVADWGYDTDFGTVEKSARHIVQKEWSSALVEVSDDAVRVEAGGAIDLGGIGKGLVADMTCDLLRQRGATRIVVDIGGDVALHGDWSIDASDDNGDSWARWNVSGGGVATSAVTYRTWSTSTGREVHHLIDPRTGAPASSTYTAVSAHATSACAAEVAAKVALISGCLDRATTVGGVAVGLFRNGLCDVPASAKQWASPVMVFTR